MTASQHLITAAEAAERLGVTVTTINRWAKAGELKPAVKVPGLRGPNLFDAEDVEGLRAQRGADQ